MCPYAFQRTPNGGGTAIRIARGAVAVDGAVVAVSAASLAARTGPTAAAARRRLPVVGVGLPPRPRGAGVARQGLVVVGARPSP